METAKKMRFTKEYFHFKCGEIGWKTHKTSSCERMVLSQNLHTPCSLMGNGNGDKGSIDMLSLAQFSAFKNSFNSFEMKIKSA